MNPVEKIIGEHKEKSKSFYCEKCKGKLKAQDFLRGIDMGYYQCPNCEKWGTNPKVD